VSNTHTAPARAARLRRVLPPQLPMAVRVETEALELAHLVGRRNAAVHGAVQNGRDRLAQGQRSPQSPPLRAVLGCGNQELRRRGAEQPGLLHEADQIGVALQ
jgi:hypothetical protein